MTTVETATLWVHIAAGFLALFAGVGAFVTEKGSLRHRRAGRAYVYGMVVVAATALALFALDPTATRQFLALVAVFSFYFVFSGYRVLSRKRPADAPTAVDWGAVTLYGLASVGLLAMGALQLLAGNGFAVVVLVFGVLGTVLTVADVRSFRTEADPRAWLGEHVTRMGAGYIATVTAFSAVNFVFLPTVGRWLWPTLLGTPLLVYLQRRYEARFVPA
ncbi:DUF2306 domain-containing protein [Haloarcula sp. JP-L23]|uniref:DUF2306 domain-containing protein n=1 Tax=Haloarcula sp. JP-L23 TaxID=2716717 RepID=UPI00140F0E02|nr:DUF2306 domain-containing protein [Haloarcula sp. JP-L23]